MNHVRVRAKLSAIGLCVVLASLLAGCASYKVRPLRKLDRSTARYIAEKDGVSIYVAPIEKKELKEYFNGEAIPKKHNLMPLLLTVCNDSPQTIIMHAHEMGIKTVSAAELAAMLKLNSRISKTETTKWPFCALVGASTLVGVGAVDTLVLFGAGALVLSESFMAVYEVFVLASLALAVIPAIYLASCACDQKRQFYLNFSADMYQKIFAQIVLGAGESDTKLMFVAADQLKPTLSFIVHSGADKELSGKTEFVAEPVERNVQK